MPSLSEEQANTILDTTIADALTIADEEGKTLELSTVEKLTAVFGDSGGVVAQLIMLGAMRGFEQGVVAQLPTSDRLDILAAALRGVHTEEMFGDCTEDGDHYPCRTVRALDLVAPRA